ncbi:MULTISPECIES: SagB/ThcOx family dehydrogenase [Streptomyces]|uniref:SagB family peptide dehydrogenase n=2 Tax=Streptomyces TaxID=1883 RepID=A0ABV9IRP0_9ACTN
MSAERPSSTAVTAPTESRCVGLWSLREDVLVDMACPASPVVLSGRWGEVRLHQAGPAVREALRRMSLGPISLANVVTEAVAERAVRPSSPGGRTATCPTALGPDAEILMMLHRLQHLVVRSLTIEGSDHLLMSVIPIAQSARYAPVAADRHRPVRLSRFAFLRTEGDDFVLESPAALYRVVLHGPEAAWVIGMLGRPVTVADMAATVPLPATAILGITSHLLATGLAIAAEPAPGEPTSHGDTAPTSDTTPARTATSAGGTASDECGETSGDGAMDDCGDTTAGRSVADVLVSARKAAEEAARAKRTAAVPVFAEDHDPALLSWSAVDLLFHSRSTLGRHDADFGATYPLADRMGPAPAVKPLPDGPRLALPRPSLSEVAAGDPPLTEVVEKRHSIRSYGPTRLTAAVLGEFLYRAVRIRDLYEPRDKGEHNEAYTDRPYPSGGRAYELEFYLTVRDCAGVPTGTHYYAPLEHCLVHLDDGEAGAAGSSVSELFAEAQITAGLADPPSVVITITSRIHRLSWKYSGLPYALTLKHVGAVTQNLYLIGTAMGLASCALGSGDIELAARTTGTDWRTEPSVGGFVLGIPPMSSPNPRQTHAISP